MKKNLEFKKLAILFIFALVIKLPFVMFLSLPLMGDAEGYMNSSRNLAEEGFYSTDGVNPELGFPPGYPLLLAGMHKIFGFSSTVPLYFHVLFSALECVLLYLLCKKLYSERVGYIAYALYLVLPGINLHLPTQVSENASFLFLTLFMFLWFYYRDNKNVALDIALGICLAWLIYSRSVFIVIIPLLALGWLVWKNPILKRRAVVCIGIVLIVMFVWALRNEAHSGKFSIFGEKGKLELYMGTRIEFDGQSVGHPQLLEDNTWWNRDKHFQDVYNQYPDDPEKRKEVLYQEAIDTIKEHPIGIARIGSKGMLYYFWFPPYAYNFLVKDYVWSTGYDLSEARFVMTYFANLYYVAWIFFLAMVILGICVYKMDDFKWLVLGTCILMSAALALFEPIPRYHTALLPLLIPMAAVGIDYTYNRFFRASKVNFGKRLKNRK
jgi:4-amino-4-deoxy-L-arabinose transferase-like glycosyltransferase